MTEMTLKELTKLVAGRLSGDGERIVRGVASLEAAGQDEVSFLANPRYERHMAATKAAAVLVAEDYAGPCESLIRCEDPYFAFREAMVAFYGFRAHGFEGVDDRAIVDPSAQLAEGVAIGPLAVISAGCRIGAGVVIYPGVFVGPGCVIGDDCTIYPNVTLYDGTILHDRVTIHAGSSIGHDGFGYATHNGVHEKIPQTGWVEIESDVEIGACCAIDRATMGATKIGPGSKFSNLVAIGHGARLGKGCLLVAQVGIAGSVTAGDYCIFAGQSGVANHLHIGDGAKVLGRAGVTNDIPAGVEVFGFPARPRGQAKRAMISMDRLPQIRTAVKRLSKEVQRLKRLIVKKGDDDGGKDQS